MAPPSPEANLNRVSGQAGTLYQQVWQADAAPTTSQMEAMNAVEHDSAEVMGRWSDFKNTDLPALNRLLRESQVPEIKLPQNGSREEVEGDEE
jgi:hypothetical protein